MTTKCGLRTPSRIRVVVASCLSLALVGSVLMLQPCAASVPTYVEGWGANYAGQCNAPAGLTNAIALSAGDDFCVALKGDGTVVAWGSDNNGQCDVPPGLTNVAAISASAQRFVLALKTDGTVTGWGNNYYGQLNFPPELSNVVAIAAGFEHSLAVKADGTVVAWGGNMYGETNVPAGLNGATTVAAWLNSLALRSDGTVVAWGGDDLGANDLPAGLSNVIAIATGQHSLALKNDGSLVGCGSSDYGEATAPAGLNSTVAVAVGAQHSLALKSDGTVVAWGYNGSGQGIVPTGLSGASAICAGLNFNLVVTTNPLIQIKSQPQNLITNAGSAASLSVSVSCKVPVSYQWMRDGTNLPSMSSSSLTWDSVQIEDSGNYAVVISHPTLSITSDVATLTITAPPPPATVPVIVNNPQHATVGYRANAFFGATVSSDEQVTYYWLKNGTNIIWANSSNLVVGPVTMAEVGDYALVVANPVGSVTSAPARLNLTGPPMAGTVVSLLGSPLPAGLTNIVRVSASETHAVALRADGTVIEWPDPGPLSLTPPVPPGLSNVVEIVAGSGYTLALKSDSTVISFGNTGVPDGLTDITAIASGDLSTTLTVKRDGTVLGWGGSPTSRAFGPLTNVVSVAAGLDQGVALLRDGSVVAWPPINPLDWPVPIFQGIEAVSLFNHSPTALRPDGTVIGKGVPDGISNVVAIAGGFVLKQDGTVISIGASPVTASITNVIWVDGSGLAITLWPAIVSQPQGATLQGGTNFTLSVAVQGSGPFTFQWKKDGVEISGATQSTFVITNAQTADAGNYTVVVSNGSGSVESVAGVIDFFAAPTITTQPQDLTAFAGAFVGFHGAALGANPLQYQWQHDGTPIPGATTTDFTIAQVSAADAGIYTLAVSNSLGHTTSREASLRVTSAPTWRLSSAGTVVSLNGSALPAGLTNIVAVAAGSSHGLALRSNGTVMAWGGDDLGQATVPAGLSNVVAISAGDDHSLALRSDGTVVGWGGVGAEIPQGLYGAVAISAGYQVSVAIKSDGSVYSWTLGQEAPVLSRPPASLTNATAIAAGLEGFLGLRSDGTVIAWGGVLDPDGTNLTGLSNIVQVAIGGSDNAVSLRNDGTVAGASAPPGLSNVVAIAAGNRANGLALKSDGTVVGWGPGMSVPDSLTGVSAIAAGGFGLAITTNSPPQPALKASLEADGSVSLKAPVSVTGYILQSSDGSAFSDVQAYTNSFIFTNSEDPGFRLAPIGGSKFFRLRAK